MLFDLEEELKKLPASPGVYLMHNNRDEIIYVGKAISLKNRVRQYFQSSRNKTAKIQQMVSHIAWFEYILTDSELEALVLECNLIKEHRPRYNTMLKDDKTYPYIKATIWEDFPRLLFSRDMKKDGRSRYFGPYTSAGAVKDSLELIHKLYRIRTCNRSLPKDTGKERPCLNYHIHQCDAPCQGYISKEEYQESFKGALDFLGGHYEPLLKSLEDKMYDASEKMEFEKAIEYRELLNSVKQVAQKQKITSSGREDRDIVAMARAMEDVVVQVFFIREGKMIGRDHFYIQAGMAEEKGEIISGFVKQFYAGTPFIPREVWLQYPIEDEENISQRISQKKGQKVKLVVPQKGDKERLVELAARNAALVLTQDEEKIKREERRTIGAVHEIEELLGMEGLNRMEAFDISNISGFQTVASMVVFERGKARRRDYRKFRLRTIEGPDDYASMEEVLTRRFLHGKKELEELKEQGKDTTLGSFTKFPDILMMDGGKGQVNVALCVLDHLGLDIPVCGMVKDDDHRTRGLYYNNEEIIFAPNSEAFLLVTRIQDEAHRFAIEYHRSLRAKGQVHSVLDDIKGVGPKRRKELMKYFKDLGQIKTATVTELLNVPGMNQSTAESIYGFFHDSKQ